MADQPETSVPLSIDMGNIAEQTQLAALKLLDDKALAVLLRNLRAMKASHADVAVQKTLAQAIRRGVAEKRSRAEAQPKAGAPTNGLAKPGPEKPGKPDKADKAEEKRRKEAERAEKKRVRAAERAELKTARDLAKAEKQTTRQAKAAEASAKPKKEKPKRNKKNKQDKPGDTEPSRD